VSRVCRAVCSLASDHRAAGPAANLPGWLRRRRRRLLRVRLLGRLRTRRWRRELLLMLLSLSLLGLLA
jgi:hypothetical protein